MGLFRFLFGKKNKNTEPALQKCEAKPEAAQPCEEEMTYIEPKPRAPRKPGEAKKTVVEPSAECSKTEDFDTEDADKIATESESKNVKVQGFGGSFEIKKSKDGRFVFNLYAKNRVIVATSQIYSSAQSAITGINSVVANAEKAAIEDQTLKSFIPQSFPKWEIYIDKAGQFRFRLLASNGSCVCHSQGYTQKSTCKKGIESIIRTVKNAEIDKAYLKK